MLNIAVGGHNLTIVAHDTTPTEPVEVTHFHIGPGQRYDVLLKATQPSGSYWLEATVIERNIPDLIGRGIIHYGSEKFLPTDEPFHPPWNDTDMCVGCDRTINPESYPEFPALTTPESEITRYTLVLNQVFLIENDGRQTGIAWGLNNITFAFTTPEPLIGMAVKAAKENGWPTEIPGTIDLPQNPATPWNYSLPAGSLGLPGQNAGGNGISVIRANYNQVFDIILQNTNMPTDPHPWHMHGHSFWVIGGGKGIFDAEKDVPKFNLKNPVLRDTVDMWSNGWTAIRFIAINPGVWFFHCHVLSHLRMGIAAAVVTQADEITDFPRVPNSVQYCNKIDSLEISADDSAGSSISISVSILAAAIASMLAYY
jgi:FtsP/CotA-like multicopper oxidase with cupredoxin domain